MEMLAEFLFVDSYHCRYPARTLSISVEHFSVHLRVHLIVRRPLYAWCREKEGVESSVSDSSVLYIRTNDCTVVYCTEKGSGEPEQNSTVWQPKYILAIPQHFREKTSRREFLEISHEQLDSMRASLCILFVSAAFVGSLHSVPNCLSGEYFNSLSNLCDPCPAPCLSNPTPPDTPVSVLDACRRLASECSPVLAASTTEPPGLAGSNNYGTSSDRQQSTNGTQASYGAQLSTGGKAAIAVVVAAAAVGLLVVVVVLLLQGRLPLKPPGHAMPADEPDPTPANEKEETQAQLLHPLDQVDSDKVKDVKVKDAETREASDATDQDAAGKVNSVPVLPVIESGAVA